MKDVAIVGGGIAGLAAGWWLRHRDIALLESGARVGGRVRSERRGPYWLNWGGHVYAGGESATARLLADTGVESVAVPGSLAGLSMNGKLLLKGRVETYPFRIPMSRESRRAMVTAGMKVRLAVERYARLVGRRPGESEASRQQRVYDFMNDRSFADFVGSLPPDAEALFAPTVTRSSAELDQISAGAGIGYFSLVWNIGEGLSQSILGGPSTLTETIAAALGERVQLGAAVQEIVQKKSSVVVRYRQDDIDREVEARYVVLATPAPISHQLGVDLDDDVREALARIEYGPFVSAAFLTNETEPRSWDNAYAIAAPKRSFNVALNMSNIVHGYATERQPGSSIMTFSPGNLARKLMELDDDAILATYEQDLAEVLPGFGGTVVESEINRWPIGSPYCFPGRAGLQRTLTRNAGRVMLAGDYLGTSYTETAVHTGLKAAQEVQSLLGTDRQHATPLTAVPTAG